MRLPGFPAILTAAFLAAAPVSAPAVAQDALVRVVDVGAGLCVVAVTPDSHAMVYDAGFGTDRCRDAVRELVPSRQIDLLVLSHSDRDHIGASRAILEENAVATIIHSGDPRGVRLNPVREAIAAEPAADVWNLTLRPVPFGQQFHVGAATATFVAGWSDGQQTRGAGDPSLASKPAMRHNALSSVIRFEFGGHSVLLTGDTVGRLDSQDNSLCQYAERKMVENAAVVALKSDVLVGQHHGADNATANCFITEVQPEFVVFSAGHSHRHPRQSAADRLVANGVDPDNIFRTDRGDHEAADGRRNGSTGVWQDARTSPVTMMSRSVCRQMRRRRLPSAIGLRRLDARSGVEEMPQMRIVLAYHLPFLIAAVWPAVAQSQGTALSVAVASPRAITAPVACPTSIHAFYALKSRVEVREDRISDHHRPVPILRLEGLAPAGEAKPVKPVETSVRDPAGSTIEIRRSTPLTAVQGLTSAVGEPTAVTRGNEVLATGNWYAAVSSDGGATFTCIDPAASFPRSPKNQDFCCDQVALFDPNHDLMIWLLQYLREDASSASRENILRIAVASGADINAGRYRYYDLSPSAFGGSSTEWFDFPDLMTTAGHLYITTNAFHTGPVKFTRSVVMRLPLNQLRQYGALSAQYHSPRNAGTLRLAQGSGATAYFATHAIDNSADYLRIYSWPDSTTSITAHDVKVQSWRTNATAPGPDGLDWLRRSDGRLTAGWRAIDLLGFAWTAAQDSTFKYPHVRMALVRVPAMTLVAEPHLWNGEYAFAYPSAGPNGSGEIGLGVFYGGNKTHPSHAVGRLVRSANGTYSWELVRAVAGSNGPADEKWGDYTSVRAHGTDPSVWVASAYALDGGTSQDDIRPRYIEFRVRSQAAASELKEQAKSLIEDTERLNAVLNQQPENRAAIDRLLMRIQSEISTLKQGVPAADPSDRAFFLQRSIDDTHRPTPVDSKEPSIREDLTSQELSQIVTTAESLVRALDQALDRGRNIAAEKRIAEQLERAVAAMADAEAD